jgi:hypothetical protein
MRRLGEHSGLSLQITGSRDNDAGECQLLWSNGCQNSNDAVAASMEQKLIDRAPQM